MKPLVNVIINHNDRVELSCSFFLMNSVIKKKLQDTMDPTVDDDLGEECHGCFVGVDMLAELVCG